MDIELTCDSCGRRIRAPRKAAGQRHPCPHCGKEVYVPTPADEIQELPLADEDTGELQREARLQAERRDVDRAITHEDNASGSPAAQASSPANPQPARTVESVILSYLKAMRDTDLGTAEQALELLKNHKKAARKLHDRLATDQLPPPVMGNVPPAVYQGFLKNLRSQL